MTENHQSSPLVRLSQVFRGIRFVLLGFDPIRKSQVSRKLVGGGGVDAGQYGPNCTHVIVDKLVYDDPPCIAARQDGKILVSSLWVDHSFDVGAPVDTTSVMYTPVRDLNGIPGAKSLVICLTGYQREDREDIMTMVELMGAQVSKPLIANKVTHLICYKFEGEKYLLAKKVKRIKLINHRWLEDCLKAWEILAEADYSKSGYELEMEAEARDSEDEPEGVTTRHNEGKTASLHHSLLSKQEIPKTISSTSASELFSNAQETVSVTTKTTSDQFPNAHETKTKHKDTENFINITSEPSYLYEKTASSLPAQNNLIPAYMSANKSPQNEAKMAISVNYSMKDPIRTTPPKIDMKSNTSSAKRLNKLNLSDASNRSSSLVHTVTPYSRPAFCLEDEQNDASSNKRKIDILCGSSRLQQMSQINDAETAFHELKKDPPIERSPAQKSPSNISGRKSLSSKGKNVSSDVPISKTSASEIEDLNLVQRPREEYKETSPSTKSNNKDVGMTENGMHSPSLVTSDLQKSNALSSEINDQSAGSNSKPVRRKSISKKFSAPKLSKKITVNQKGSISLENAKSGIDDENLLKYQQSEKVSPVTKSGTKIEMGVISGMQIENKSENRSLCMDDETEPPDDEDEARKEKREYGEPEYTVDVLMEEKEEGNIHVEPSTGEHNDVNDLLSLKHKVPAHKSDGNTEDLASEIPSTKKVKKNTPLSIKEVTDKKFVKKNKLMIDDKYGKQDIREEATPNQAKRARRNANDLEKSMEVKSAGACNNPDCNNDEKEDDVDADMDTGNFLNQKDTKRNTCPQSKTEKDVSKRNVTDLEKSENVEKAGVSNDPEHQNEGKDNDVAKKDADIDAENVLNNKETKRNKRPLSRTKKDDVKAVNKKGKSTSNQAVRSCDNEDAQKENVQIHVDDGAHKDAGMATENVLNKKETKKNKRPLSRTKKDDVKAVNKKGNPPSNQAVKTCDLEEQKENIQIHVDDQSPGNKHVSKPAEELPAKNTDKGNSDVVKDEPMWFILTGHMLQRKEFQQIIRRLKGRVCRVNHNWSYQATHFIVPDPIRRTEKFFAAAASGRWILKTDYLSASNQAGKFLAEESYEWHKNGLSEDGQINLEAPRKWRLLKEKTGHGAFYGAKIVIYGECIAPSLDTLKRAVKAGDGTILATSPPYTRFLNTGIDFAVVSPGMPHVDVWVQEFIRHEIPCVSADYLVEYVCKPGYPLERHVQFGTTVWAERSYNILKNRLEEEISEPKTPNSNDVACEVCGARDRGDEMLICGDESGMIGCGVGTHIDCCDPPLEGVPEEDWFCSKCSKKHKNKKGSKKKGPGTTRGKQSS